MKNCIIIPLYCLTFSFGLLSCSAELEDARNSLDSGDEDLTSPSEISGSFLTTACTPELGGLNCIVKDKEGNLIDFSESGLGYKPNYDLYLSKDLANDTPASIEEALAGDNPDNLFKHTGSSLPKAGSGSTIAISFIGQDYLTKSMGTNKLSKAEKRDDNVGQIFTYSQSDYAPAEGKKHVKINRCIQAVLMETWLTGGTSEFIEVDFTFDDLTNLNYEIFGGDESILAYSTDNTERWNYSVQWGIAVGIDDFDSAIHDNFDAALDPATTCRSKYEAFKAGESNDLFTEMETEVSNLVSDFMNYKAKK